MKKLFLRGGVILSLAAMTSKFFGLIRDRLLVAYFPPAETDLIFTAFRIPDFFFYLFVGATLSVIVIPQLENLEEKEKDTYLSSFFWGLFFLFGILCLMGFFGSSVLVDFYTDDLAPALHTHTAQLSSLLFISIFILGLSSLFAAYFQHQNKIFSLALGPLIYTFSICTGLFWFQNRFGIQILGYSAIFGATLYLCLNLSCFYRSGKKVRWAWKKPTTAWRNFKGDFFRRVLGNSAYQINQSLDILIANLLITGTATAFSMGSNLGHILLSIVGMPIANIAFPKLSAEQNKPQQQKIILKKSIYWILIWTIPFSLLSVFVSQRLLGFIYDLPPTILTMSHTVFVWTVISLPAACLIPTLSRFFLANQDTHTPLYTTIFSLTAATVLAAFLSLRYLPPENAILGLAIGNFTANYLLMGILCYFVFWKKQSPLHSEKK